MYTHIIFLVTVREIFSHLCASDFHASGIWLVDFETTPVDDKILLEHDILSNMIILYILDMNGYTMSYDT